MEYDPIAPNILQLFFHEICAFQNISKRFESFFFETCFICFEWLNPNQLITQT